MEIKLRTQKIKHDKDYLPDLMEHRSQVELLRSQIQEARSQQEKIVESMKTEIAEENSLFENMKIKQKTEIFEIMKKCEDDITRFRGENEQKIRLLKAEIDVSKTHLDDILKADNLLSERELYWKRSKVEKQHLATVAKYDTNIGALYYTMENLKGELNSLNEKLENIREELAIQDVEYVELKNERELNILKAFTENLENFEKKRAAKIIQRAWRIYFERRALRKKKKSKKKKGCVDE